MAIKTRYSTRQMIRELEREIEMRRKVFGRKVEQGTMTQDAMDEAIALIEDAVLVLKNVEMEGMGTLLGETIGEGVLTEYQITLAGKHAAWAHKKGYDTLNVKAQYVDGYLSAVLGLDEVARITTKYPTLPIAVPIRLDTVEEVVEANREDLCYHRITTSTTKQKMAAFIKCYKEVFDQDYGNRNKRGKEAKEWKMLYLRVPADEGVIRFYLTTQQYPIKGAKSISDYCRNYNSILELMKTKKAQDEKKNQRFPNHFDPIVWANLGKNSPAEFQAYEQHLAANGWEKVKAIGRTFWRKKGEKHASTD